MFASRGYDDMPWEVFCWIFVRCGLCKMYGNGLQNMRNKRSGFYQKIKKEENDC